MRWLLSACLAIVLLSGVSATSAQDSPPPPDNLCDEDQAWGDGRCEIPQFPGATELAWECGWYMARVRDGRLSTAQVPTQCRHLLETLMEICKSQAMNENAPAFTRVICLRSDQTGTDRSFEDGEVYSEYLFRFVADPEGGAGCPEVPGYVLIYWNETSYLAQKFRDGFSARDLFDVLKLQPYVCTYYPDATPG